MTLTTLAPLRDGRAVALYRRVSTDRQDTARQEAGIFDLAARLWPDAATIDVTDDGVSAFHNPVSERPGGQELFRLVGDRAIVGIVADTQDRLSRGSQAEFWTFYDLCQQHGVTIATVENNGAIAETPEAQTIAAMRQAFGRQESAVKSHRAKTGIQERRANGLNRGQRLPLGLRNTTANIPEPDESFAAVEQVFVRFDAGTPVKALARYLTAELGRPVTPGYIRNILRNPTYAGWWLEDRDGARILHEGQHGPEYGRRPPIDRDLFNRVQKRLQQQAADATRYSRVNPFPGSIFRCGDCGSALSRHRSDSKYEFHRCEHKGCRAVSIPSEHLEASIVGCLQGVYLALSDRLADPAWSLRANASDLPDEEALRASEAELAALDTAERKALELLRDPDMPVESIQEQLKEIRRDRIDLEDVRNRLARQESGRRAELEALRDALAGDDADVIGPFRTIALWLALDTEERQRWLGEIFEKVRAYKDGTLSLDFAAGFGIGTTVKTRRDGASADLLSVGFGLGPKNPLVNHGFPRASSGCPDLNWGPLRPERSALPGCATPRATVG